MAGTGRHSENVGNDDSVSSSNYYGYLLSKVFEL